MKLDLFKLNNLNSLDINEDITFDQNEYTKMDVRDIKNAHVKGRISINYNDEIEASLVVTGTFIMGCAITLEDVPYEFSCEIEEIIGKFEEIYNNNKNMLDILPFIWENIVSEVPIRVIKEGIIPEDTHGDGWEFISSNE